MCVDWMSGWVGWLLACIKGVSRGCVGSKKLH